MCPKHSEAKQKQWNLEHRKLYCRGTRKMGAYTHTKKIPNSPKSFSKAFIFYYFFLLYNIALVLPYINMHLPRVYTCSPSWNPLPPPSLFHPSGSPQCTSPKLPVSCIKPGLTIRFLYDIIHVLMPLSQIIPPPSPTESKRLFYTSVTLAKGKMKECVWLLQTSWCRNPLFQHLSR